MTNSLRFWLANKFINLGVNLLPTKESLVVEKPEVSFSAPLSTYNPEHQNMWYVVGDDITNKVILLVQEIIGVSQGEVMVGSTRGSLSMDSLDEIEVVIGIEEMFDIEISDYEASKVRSVQGMIDLVKWKLRV